MPTGFGGGALGVFEPGVDEIVAEQQVMAIVYRDPFTNKFSVVRWDFTD